MLIGTPLFLYRWWITEKVAVLTLLKCSPTAARPKCGITLISELLMFMTSILLGMCPFVDRNLSTVLHVTRLPVVQTVA